MALPNARRILSTGLSFSTFKMLTMQASISRPGFRPLGMAILGFFVHDGEMTVRYSTHGRRYTAYIRMADMASDLFTVKELGCGSIYPLDPTFAPDLVVDGGGNIGLFSLLASAAYPSAKIVICEPVPACLAQIDKHLRTNRVEAEILPVCLGGSRRSIPFYIREGIASSFDPEKPYTSRTDVSVVTLEDVLRGRDAERVLIKLDIEGMELEVLEAYVPRETRPVCVVGELHRRKSTGARLEEIFRRSGWTLNFLDSSETDSIFEARSPAAMKRVP